MSEHPYRRVELITDDVEVVLIKGQLDRAEAAAVASAQRTQWDAEHVVVDCGHCGRLVRSDGVIEVLAGWDILADPVATDVGREVVVRHRYGCSFGPESRRVIEAHVYFYAGVNAVTATALIELVAAGDPRISIAEQIVQLGVPHVALIDEVDDLEEK